jgi:tRNA modification GTPase
MLEDLHARGCRPAEPGEFTKRAFLNGRIDLSQAEAVMDLIHARSERALEAANRQLRGSLGRHIAKAIAQLVDIIAQVEAYIDFPEEDLPAEDRSRLIAGVGALARDIDRLLATAPYGALLREGVRTVIVGEPNVGKSSLLNRLVGWERALVSPEPGTTRDYLEEPRALGAHIIRFVDTAGLNPEPGELERRGIERTIECASEADLFLLVLDATCPCPSLPRSVVERLNCGNTVVVWNKADLQTPNLPNAAFSGWQQVAVSAATGSGISALEQAIVELIDRREHSIDGDFVAINARHATDLSAAAACLRDAENKLRCSVADELMAADLRGALDALGRIGGRVDHEQILDRLFACFCIGK